MLLIDDVVPPLLPVACFGVAAPDEIHQSLASEEGLPKPTTEFIPANRCVFIYVVSYYIGHSS